MTMNYYRVIQSTSIRSARIAFLLLSIAIFGTASFANTRAVNLSEMTSRAGRIVHGRVVEVRDGTHPKNEQIAVTFVKIQVTDMIKGEAVRDFTFMQYGNSTHLYVVHLPRYSVGEEVVLFLYAESKLGFTSPVGEGQGKFVVRDNVRSGQRQLINEQLNRSLFDRLDAAKLNSKLSLNKAEREVVARPEGRAGEGLEFGAFRSLVRKIAASPNATLQ